MNLELRARTKKLFLLVSAITIFTTILSLAGPAAIRLIYYLFAGVGLYCFSEFAVRRIFPNVAAEKTDGATKRGEIKFEMRQGNKAVVEIVINNVPCFFSLDTGAEQTVISSSLAEKLKLEPVGKISIGGVGNDTVDGSVVKPEIFVIGSWSIKNLYMAAFDIKHGWKDYAGLLGADILQQFTVTIDYKNKILRLERG